MKTGKTRKTVIYYMVKCITAVNDFLKELSLYPLKNLTILNKLGNCSIDRIDD